MLKDYIQLGDTLDIEADGICTKTKVQDMIGKDRFVVLQPTYKLVPMLIRESETARFTFYRSNGIFTFLAVLDDRVLRDNLKMYYFRLVSDIEKKQRRYGYRLPVVLNADVRLLDSNAEESEKPPECKAKTINLSEKGVLFTCFEPFEIGMRLWINLKMDAATSLALFGEVVRCEPPLQKTDPYAIAVQFYNYSKKDQIYIGKFILKKQIFDRKTKQG
jgi:hypothetical protein